MGRILRKNGNKITKQSIKVYHRTYRLSDRQIDSQSKGMQGHLLGPLRKIFYIKSEVYDKLKANCHRKKIEY